MPFDFCVLRRIPRRLPVLVFSLAPSFASAGVANPDLSAIGQVLGGISDEAGSVDQNEPTLRNGEVELVLEAYLNPYLKGWFTLSGGEDGFAVEEAYTSMVKGLPWSLGLKAGKYRLGFGKLNPLHPHTLPFMEPPRAWVSLMPGGDEGFNQAAVQASWLLPMPGDWASTLSLDLLQGSEFHPDEEQTRLGWLGRWSNSFLLGETGALDLGVSGATGIDMVAKEARGYLAGADLKAKFYLPHSSQFTLQGEGLYRLAHTLDTSTGSASGEERRGAYAFADFRYQTQYNFGVIVDQTERAGDASKIDRAVKGYAGYAVLEESTLIRLAYEYFMPDGEAAVNTVSLQLLFSMGPHKPHQF